MDYETPDGSQFSLREVWKELESSSEFDYTTVSAYVDGIAYVGKLPKRPDEVDDEDVLKSLEPVPPDCIHPRFQEGLTVAPSFDSQQHYLKAPSFTYDDCRPGQTFVADCVLSEVAMLERLKQHPHPNIVAYHGCVVRDDRITHICLKRYQSSLQQYAERGLTGSRKIRVFNSARAAIEHLHSLGLAHNDVNPDNLCVDSTGHAILIDFDSCMPFGEKLRKGVGHENLCGSSAPVSAKENDYRGLDDLEDFLWAGDRDPEFKYELESPRSSIDMWASQPGRTLRPGEQWI